MRFKDIAIAQGFDYTKLSHRSDPVTSRIGAKAVVRSGKLGKECTEIYEALKRFNAEKKKSATARSCEQKE